MIRGRLYRPRWLRRAGLFVVGAAPFVFFLLLLPPNTPTGSPANPTTTSTTLPGEQRPLEFPEVPFLAAASPSASPEDLPETASSPNPRPSPSPSPRNAEASTTTTSAPAQTAPAAPTAPAPRFGAPNPGCSNGIDDDGDGASDMADPGCSSGADHAEADNPQCSDGLDDDGDGTVDSGDPGCSSPRDGDESDDNIIPEGSQQSLPGQPGGDGGGSTENDSFPLEGLPS